MKKLKYFIFCFAIFNLLILITPLSVNAENMTGTYGNNLTWTLDSEGTLTISGQGDMRDYVYSTAYTSPWNKCKTDVNKVIIEDGVTSIGDFAFNNFVFMTEIEIPESVTRIGIDAFWECSNLANITIPEGVTHIDDAAFASCYDLTDIVLPKSITDIGKMAFYSCSKLSNVYYKGTEKQWQKITIGTDNSYLTDATIHYSGFSSTSDAWNFINTADSFQYPENYSIPAERYEEVFGASYVASAMASDDKIFQSMMGQWGGSCYGMCVTSVLFYNNLLDWNEYGGKNFESVNDYYSCVGNIDQSIYSISYKDSAITKLIEQYQILPLGTSAGYVTQNSSFDKIYGSYVESTPSKYTGWFTKTAIHNHLSDGDYIQSVYQTIRSADEPLCISMYSRYGSHEIVTRTDKEPLEMSDGWIRVYIYDPNQPSMPDEIIETYGCQPHAYYLNHFKEDSYIELNPDKNLWRYRGNISATDENHYWGSDADDIVLYHEESADGYIRKTPEYMYIFSISDVNYPLYFNGTEEWIPRWKDKAAIVLIQDSNFTICSASGTELCKVINGIPFSSVDDIEYYPFSGSTEAKNTGGKLIIPYTDFIVKCENDQDISIIGSEGVMNIASTGKVTMDISMTDYKMQITGEENTDIITQITDVYSNSVYTSIVADGSLEKGDCTVLQLEDDKFSANISGSGTMNIYTDNDKHTDNALLMTLDQSNSKVEIENVRDEVSGNETAELPFTDVAADSWYYEFVDYVYQNQLMKGTSDTTFSPNTILSRSQFATILYRINGSPETVYVEKFPDVPDNTWYTDAVLWANENSIIVGYPNGRFGTTDNISREQMALMMYRYAKMQNYNTNQSGDMSRFSDYSKVSSYASDAMRWAVGSGIIAGKGDGTILDPQGSATRAECATIIMRFMKLYDQD